LERLAALEWQLDRIEDALVGDNLDDLELLIQQQEVLGARIERFVTEVRSFSPKAFDPRKSRRR
jgi:hypothetical protein